MNKTFTATASQHGQTRRITVRDAEGNITGTRGSTSSHYVAVAVTADGAVVSAHKTIAAAYKANSKTPAFRVVVVADEVARAEALAIQHRAAQDAQDAAAVTPKAKRRAAERKAARETSVPTAVKARLVKDITAHASAGRTDAAVRSALAAKKAGHTWKVIDEATRPFRGLHNRVWEAYTAERDGTAAAA